MIDWKSKRESLDTAVAVCANLSLLQDFHESLSQAGSDINAYAKRASLAFQQKKELDVKGFVSAVKSMDDAWSVVVNFMPNDDENAEDFDLSGTSQLDYAVALKRYEVDVDSVGATRQLHRTAA